MKIKILPPAQQILDSIQTADAAAEAKLEEMIGAAAGVDGDRVLDELEAQAVKNAFLEAVPQGGCLTADNAGPVQSALAVQLASLQAARPQATDVLFTSEGKALARFRAAIIGSIQESIDRAAGRPVDINMMVFSFTDKVMADQILEMAEQYPNVSFRLLTDWSQLPTSGNRQPSRIIRLAAQRGLPNIQVKFKKDNPYAWDADKKQPVYNHGSTTGLNHHKGFVTLIDGRVDKMTLGSFNWSVSAMKSNFENLMVLDRMDPDNRAVMQDYQEEFEAFWNNDDAALTQLEAGRYKEECFAALYAAHNEPYTPYDHATGSVDDPLYDAVDTAKDFDLNSFADSDVAKLESLLGKKLAAGVHKELSAFGRFDTWTELLTRVPGVAEASSWALEQLRENLEYGGGKISINTATVEELDRAGLSRRQAEAIVAFREQHGAFESLAELDAVKGIGPRTLEKVGVFLTADEVIGVYSGTTPGQPTTAGFADHPAFMKVPSAGLDAPSDELIAPNRESQAEIDRTLAAVVTDMLRRTAPGQTFRLSMYGVSTSSPEFKELEAAIERGVPVRAVIFEDYNAKAISRLIELRDAGRDVDLRVVDSPVMHEKFAVRGDDVFNGSSNWSTTSVTKNAEDRYYFRNNPALAKRFVEELERLWAKGDVV